MIANYNNLSFVVGVPGIILQILGALTPGPGLELLGTVLLTLGLAYYAMAKGRSPAWCLLGLLSIIGIVLLACLDDKSTDLQGKPPAKPTPPSTSSDSPSSPSC